MECPVWTLEGRPTLALSVEGRPTQALSLEGRPTQVSHMALR